MRSSGMSLLGLAFVVFGWVLVFVLPTTRFFAWIIMGIGGVVLIAGVVLDFRRMRAALASGRGRFGIGTSVAISLFLGIVLVVNAINVSRYHRFDFTGLDRYTLSSKTKEALAALGSDIEVLTMFTPRAAPAVQEYARNLLSEYRVYSDRMSVRHVDPELQPDVARRYGLGRSEARSGVVLFRGPAGERRVLAPRIVAEAEHAFTSAILEVSGARRKRVYYLVGHGEQSPSTSYSAAWEGLLDNLFEIEELDLDRRGLIPQDAAAVVIAGPTRDLSSVESRLVADYVAADGGLFLLLDPDPPASFRDLARGWGVRVEDGIVIEPQAFVAPFRTSPLVSGSRNAFRIDEVVFSGATGLLPGEEPPNGLQIEPIAWTTESAWLETEDQGEDEEAVYDAGVDSAGPLAIAVAIAGAGQGSPSGAGRTGAAGARQGGAAGAADQGGTAGRDGAVGRDGEADRHDGTTGAGSRIIVVGDSDFASNRNFHNLGNGAFFLTSVNWLTAGEEIVSIDRRPLVTRRLLLTPEQARFVHFSSIALLPALLLVAAGYVFWTRRR